MPEVHFHSLGLRDYKEVWDYQEALFKKTVDLKIRNRKSPEGERVSTQNHLLFCEHPHVYTLGKSGKPENLLIDEAGLKNKDAAYYKINRGGDVTYHGPGQLVAYPIFDLDQFFTDIHKYLRYLEEAIILTLADFHIEAGRVEGLTGVWLDGDNPEKARKICAMGVKCSRWVTMHGLALNVTANLDYFNGIVPCGIEDKAVTSMHLETSSEVSVALVGDQLQKHLANLFGYVYVGKVIA